MQDRIVSRNGTIEQHYQEEAIEIERYERSQTIPTSIRDLSAEEQAEYAAWSDQQNEQTPDPEPWTLESRNGQELVVVDGVTIGRIFVRRDDDVWNTYWTHSDNPKDRLGGRKYWTDRDECILDLVNRYHKQLAKRSLVQFADGSTGYAAPEDVDFINWIIERNRGEY